MSDSEFELAGGGGRIFVRHWRPEQPPRVVVVLAHGHAEHSGRYEHVAERLVIEGAVVYAPDHRGHGGSEGERALVTDIADLVADLHLVEQRATTEFPGLPVVLIGHSMGGIVATGYAQQHREELAGLVLSGPLIGGNPRIEELLRKDQIPDAPIDPTLLSRDQAVGKGYDADEQVWHGPFKRETLQAMFSEVERIAKRTSLDPLPVLWLHGEEDKLAPLEPASAAIARTAGDRVVRKVYSGARHEVFNETNSDEVLRDLGEFLDLVLVG